MIKYVETAFIKRSIIMSGLPKNDYRELLINEDFKEHYQRAFQLSKCKSGSGHDNFMKGMRVMFDLQYTQVLSPQLQRYSWIDIVSSESKMHSIMNMNISDRCNNAVWCDMIDMLKAAINEYNDTKDKDTWEEIIYNLPLGFTLWMTISTNYLQLKTIYKQRKNHKLQDWKEIINMIEKLPYKEFILT